MSTVNLDSNMVRFRPRQKLLVARMARIAMRRNMGLSDVAREGTTKFVESEEERLKLPPITPEEIQRLRQQMKLADAVSVPPEPASMSRNFSLNAAAPSLDDVENTLEPSTP